MATYSISQLPAVQKAWVANNKKAAVQACRSAAHQSKAYYVQRIHAEKAVDTGMMKSAFQVTPTPNGAILTNKTAYFTVIDRGRRPGRAPPPIEPIFQWVLRKRLIRVMDRKMRFKGQTRAKVLSSHTLANAAWALARRIAFSIGRRGIKPREIATGPAADAAVRSFIRTAIDEQMARRRGQNP